MANPLNPVIPENVVRELGRVGYLRSNEFPVWPYPDAVVGEEICVRMWNGVGRDGYGGSAVTGYGTVTETPSDENDGCWTVQIENVGEWLVDSPEDLWGARR